MRVFAQWLGLAVLLLACALVAWSAFDISRSGPLDEKKSLVVVRGTSLSSIGEKLEGDGVVRSAPMFVWAARLSGKQHGLQAGEYTFAKHASLLTVLGQMRRGETVRYAVTVPEGLTVRQIERLLVETPHITGELTTLPQEGSLLPDTYAYRRGESVDKIVERMRRAMDKHISHAWQDRRVSPVARLFLKTERDVLIFASLVERETGKSDERARIAGVFYNRLKRGMKLQTDPTLIYWESKKLGVLGRGLRKSEMLRDHPYNTYVHRGLPPTPIANSGRLAIEATLRPQNNTDLYFVADGKGGHHFAKTFAEHARNVALWRKVEAQRRAKSLKQETGKIGIKR